jgi:heat-inducible transcriptional repressor
VDQDQLTSIASRLNASLIGCTADQIEARAGALSEATPLRAVTRSVMERLAKQLREADAASVEQVFSDGLLNVMEAPEFADSARLRNVFTALEGRGYLGQLVREVSQGNSVQLFIGSENAPTEMHGALGVVGVLGPTRMPYPRAVGTVRYVATLLSELVGRFHAA